MVLIAESGSTKTEWCLIDGHRSARAKTQGISPYFHRSSDIAAIIQNELTLSISSAHSEAKNYEALVKSVYYYGTGCTEPETSAVVGNALQSVFPNATIEVTYDLVASAHALCGDHPGIACILGTGSNSGYYNGSEIVRNIPGLGFILGDEGSGAYLGKLLCGAYLYRKLDQRLSQQFENDFGVNQHSLLQKVYSPGMINRYLASFAPFVSRHRGDAVIEELLVKALDDFFSLHISRYAECRSVPVHFSGSVAWVFRDVLQERCIQYQMTFGNIISEPMDGLLTYHRKRAFLL